MEPFFLNVIRNRWTRKNLGSETSTSYLGCRTKTLVLEICNFLLLIKWESSEVVICNITNLYNEYSTLRVFNWWQVFFWQVQNFSSTSVNVTLPLVTRYQRAPFVGKLLRDRRWLQVRSCSEGVNGPGLFSKELKQAWHILPLGSRYRCWY